MLFQFHKGTIKAFFRAEILLTDNDFNSIKVQLKRNAKVVILSRLLFQFHKGTIKAPRLSCTKSYKLYFNSIKVQLKRRARALRASPPVFQFHKGTIKAQKVYNDFYRFSQISIP